MMPQDAKIYVAGHTGLVGSALMRALELDGFSHIITLSPSQLDLRNQAAVNDFFAQEKPEYVLLAAAKVGGIKANIDYPAQFMYDNLMISANVIHAAYVHHVKKLLFLGSSCIYPRNCPQPIKEEYLLTSQLESTNDAYALAKIAGIKLCQSYNKQYGTQFITCMPTNLYGPGDNFDLETSHVLPALLAKFYRAQQEGLPEVVVWGSGKPFREFLYVDDLARACIFLMHHYTGNEIINIGTGSDISIYDLAYMVKNLTGYQASIVFDATKPDGTPKKLLDVTKIHTLGWQAVTPLKQGIATTIDWCKQYNIFEKQV